MIAVRSQKPEKVPTCITELKWFHPFLHSCETVDSLLMHLGEYGNYLLRPSSTPGSYTLSVRTKSSVKHFEICVRGNEIAFGMAKFHKFSDFLNHFDSQPVLGGNSGEPVLLKTPFLVPKHKTLHEPTLIHGQMLHNPALDDGLKKAGYLIKQGGFVKTWKERWCVIGLGDLRYYQKQEDTVPKGVIDFRDCTFCQKELPAAEVSGRENVFLLATPWRTFVFAAATVSDLESWIVAIQKKLEEMKKFKR